MTETANNTDTLIKPDMRAVLARTHIGIDLHSFLLPILEAISNSIHGIEARFKEASSTNGKIDIIFSDVNSPSKIKISITDNGIGLNDENYQSFKTPFSGYKLKLKGRGFGRFIAFKVFSGVQYSTCYEFMGTAYNRSFLFDIMRSNEILYFKRKPSFDHVGLRVEYNAPLTTWSELIRNLNEKDIVDAIASHFLPYFLYKGLPEISIKIDDNDIISITEHFSKKFVESNSGQITVEIDGQLEVLEYSLTKIAKTQSFKNHCLLFSAADRIVGSPKDLTNILGQAHFTDENNENYIIVGVVRGEAFENRLNDARTAININPKVISQIVSAVSNVIQEIETAQINKIKTSQSVDLKDALQENPILRLGLRGKTISDYVSSKPNNWTAQEFVSDLAIERFRASKELTKSITFAASNPENYINKIKDIVSKIDENNKEALAEYVIHRKNVIELVETARKFSSGTKYAPEEVIHDLIFKRFTDNIKSEYFEHNLWLIDDSLAFIPYINSDRGIKGTSRKKGDKVADLLFFDDSLVLGDNDGTTVTIVEFKKPGRNDYAFGSDKTDPVKQVLDTLELAVRSGGITKADGEYISFNGVIKRFGFIIADITSRLVEVLKLHDFNNDQNPRIWIKHRNREKIVIQVFGYDTLIENAKKRNQAFFTVLLHE